MKNRNYPISLFFGLLFVAALGLSSPNSLQAQTTIVNARDLCPTYQVDARLLDNIDNINPIMDSLSGMQPNAYPLMREWCRQQRMRMLRMISNLRNEYLWDGDMLWLDSTHCVVDAASYLIRIENAALSLLSMADNYDRLEQQRLEAEQLAELERAKAEAQRIQREKDLLLAAEVDSIGSIHKTITSVCDARGISDKAKVKELKDLYFAYLSVYNRYDLKSTNTDDSHLSELAELKSFQKEFLDSVLGDNSLLNRMASFDKVLKIRVGKLHSEVYKSYSKAFKRVKVPVEFTNINEFHDYVGQLRDIIYVQQSYLTVIALRDTISLLSNKLQVMCSKKHRDILASYKEIFGDVNQIPSYITVDVCDKFVQQLNDFIVLQNDYCNAVSRVEIIESRGDTIAALCAKGLKDVADAYKQLVDVTDFVPRFVNPPSVANYNNMLDEFEAIQRCYLTSIDLRRQIIAGTNSILSSRNTPKGLPAAYKQMQRNTNFTPSFESSRSGEDFISLMRRFIGIQGKFMSIIDNYKTIENNSKQLKGSFKDYSSIYKAYERLLADYGQDISILSETDVDRYMEHQADILAMQQSFIRLIDSVEKDDYNIRLKKVKDVSKIKLIMGLL